MGENNVYYVPEDQDAWSGRGDELADRLWDRGLFLDTPTIMERLREFRAKRRPLPACDLNVQATFGGMGVSDESQDVAVPTYLYEITCPKCGHDVVDDAYDAWAIDSDVAPKDRTINCSVCNATAATKDLRFGEAMCFARFFVYVWDCDHDKWDPNFRASLEEIVGPCHEYWDWST